MAIKWNSPIMYRTHLRKSVQKEHEWLRPFSSRHAMKLDAVGRDILVSTERWVGQTRRRDVSLSALKRRDGVLQDFPHQPQHR